MTFALRAAVASCIIGSALGCGLARFPTPSPQPLVQLASTPVPVLPELGAPVASDDAVEMYQVQFAGSDPTPGASGELWVYMPRGEATRHSLPAVLIAPAGSNLFQGMRLGEGDTPEHLPWARAGFVVVAYDLDGHAGDDQDLERFAAARGGLINARNALEFLRGRLPQVDPERVFVAGHSSAGDAALLVASHFPELAGAVVFNSAGEGCWFQSQEVLSAVAAVTPGFEEFCQTTRAANYVSHLRVPLFLFSSSEDQVVPVARIQELRDAISRAGGEVTYVPVETGDHYSSMITSGVPRAIEWTQRRGAGAPTR